MRLMRDGGGLFAKGVLARKCLRGEDEVETPRFDARIEDYGLISIRNDGRV